MSKIEYYTAVRDAAIARGDLGVARAINADLRRWGVSETSASATAEPKPKASRARKPRSDTEAPERD